MPQLYPIQGCRDYSDPSAIAGKVVILRRGGCEFVLKVSHESFETLRQRSNNRPVLQISLAEGAGASAVIIADRVWQKRLVLMATDK